MLHKVSTLHKAMRNMMSIVMTDNLAQNCTWMINKPVKLKIKNYNFPSIITNYCIKQYNVTDDQVKQRIKNSVAVEKRRSAEVTKRKNALQRWKRRSYMLN